MCGVKAALQQGTHPKRSPRGITVNIKEVTSGSRQRQGRIMHRAYNVHCSNFHKTSGSVRRSF